MMIFMPGTLPSEWLRSRKLTTVTKIRQKIDGFLFLSVLRHTAWEQIAGTMIGWMTVKGKQGELQVAGSIFRHPLQGGGFCMESPRLQGSSPRGWAGPVVSPETKVPCYRRLKSTQLLGGCSPGGAWPQPQVGHQGLWLGPPGGYCFAWKSWAVHLQGHHPTAKRTYRERK